MIIYKSINDIPDHLKQYFQSAEIGQEVTPQEYVASLVRVFEEVRRCLRPDGTFWLNIGDSYVVSTSEMKPQAGITVRGPKSNATVYGKRTRFGIPPGNLIGVPWRLALALQDAGWYLRQSIIWAKGVSFAERYHGSCLPESVKDRPTRAHEYLFLLSKERHYYYDMDAVREAYVSLDDPSVNAQSLWEDDDTDDASGRNLRSVWCVGVEPSRHAHTAPMPKGLIRPCIQLGSSEFGVCSSCGAPWERQVAVGASLVAEVYVGQAVKDYASQDAQNASDLKRRALDSLRDRKITGWAPSCACSNDGITHVPATVLDPFFGSGTTGLVAMELGRRFVGTELNPEFAGLTKTRIDAAIKTSLF